MTQAGPTTLATLAVLLAAAVPLPAQHVHGDPAAPAASAVQLHAGAHAVPLGTRIAPIVQGESLLEAYLTQPMLFGAVSTRGGALQLHTAVSLEALTLERGELGAGTYGEGYVDRRHPHTYLHELALTGMHDFGPVAASVTAGRGFAPFGTDDPMMRPFVKFPANHHLGQVLERLIVSAGVRAGPLLLEAGVFNGNEPLDAQDMGSLERFGDSWAGRATLYPVNGLELQASRAWLESPELPVGGAWNQRKWSTSARWERAHTFGTLYALAEWKRTTQVDRGIDLFSFGSALVEVELDARGWRPGLRLERTDRPEEQRLGNPFRTPWPHGGGHVLGITRWSIVGARLERALYAGPVHVAPFAEASFSRVSEKVEGPFDPASFYGGTDIWTFNIGARLHTGWHPPRMGRYGVAALRAMAAHEH